MRDAILKVMALVVALSTIQLHTEYPFGNTAMWWGLHAIIIFTLFALRFDCKAVNAAELFVDVYLLWNVFSILRGFWVAETYWDWKFLLDFSMALMLPLAAFMANELANVRRFIWGFVYLVVPSFFVIAGFIWSDSYGFYLAMLPVLIVFSPYIKPKWKYFLILCAVFIVVQNFSARSTVIRYGFALVVALLFFLNKNTLRIFTEATRKLIFILPIFLFFLAAFDYFNVFKMDEYLTFDYVEVSVKSEGAIEDRSLKVDTRTFLYQEVIDSALYNDYWLIGRTPARGNDTIAFAISSYEVSGRDERPANEVAILNIFTWTGVVGVFLFGVALWKSSSLAINNSKNKLSQMVGVYVAFGWAFSWVENVNLFNLNNLMFWMLVGLCCSKEFREMTDCEMTCWVQSIFMRKV